MKKKKNRRALPYRWEVFSINLKWEDEGMESAVWINCLLSMVTSESQ